METPVLKCRCIACLDKLPPDDNPIPHSRRVMVVCEYCGNKRCPHAWDHCWGCSSSNAPNQVPQPFTEPPSSKRRGAYDALLLSVVCGIAIWTLVLNSMVSKYLSGKDAAVYQLQLDVSNLNARLNGENSK